MNKPALLILAGGLGSRYKGSKQTDLINNQESLMEFGLYDALKSGIRKFVIVVNPEFSEEFKNRIQKILNENSAEVYFEIQTLTKFVPEEFHEKIKYRKKPLGTAHAVLCAKEMINQPFITMNADDFYGRKTFETAFDFINNSGISEHKYGLISFELKKTLSENGTVSRGICSDDNGFLKSVEEFTEIQKIKNKIVGKNTHNQFFELNENDKVSMNFWLLHPSFFEICESFLNDFLNEQDDLNKTECYLPAVIDDSIQKNKIDVRLLETTEKWMGLTYREDRETVENQINKLKEHQIYPINLWQN